MNRTLARAALALSGLAAVAGCAVIPSDPPILTATLTAEGTPVPLKQPVKVGNLAVTPIKVVEDSRCPMNARCVWAGRLVVETRIYGAGWRETANVTLGETYGTHGSVIALVEATPDKRTDVELQPGDYRFTYEAR
ncbi:MAG: hypothetical protein ACTHKM_05380 [Tsuneonella sp.]